MASATNSPWQAIASAALLGTERQPFQSPNPPGNLGHVLAQIKERPMEAALLSAAGVVALHQRLGWLPDVQPIASQETCPSDDWPRCSARAAYCLQQMLQGHYPQLLAEWLEKAAIAQQRIPEMLLPVLLDKGRQQRELRRKIVPVLGQRGQWLAEQNPDWSYVVGHTTEADWETGTAEVRLVVLQNLRLQNPDRARELLQSTWSQESAGDRAKFLETFCIGLSVADAPLLEMALGDRRKEVRQIAAELLTHLPDASLCQCMMVLVQRYVTRPSESLSSLMVQLPDTLEAELSQLGVNPKPVQHHLNLGEKAGWLVQMIGTTPLNFWNTTWEMTAADMIKLAQLGEWQAVFLKGWTLAAQRQGDRTWAKALLQYAMTSYQPDSNNSLLQTDIETLLRVLPLEQRNTWLLDFLRSRPDTISQSFMIYLLCHSSGPWTDELTQDVLTRLENYFSQQLDMGRIAWDLRANLREFARFMPVHFLPTVLQMQAQLPVNSLWQHSVGEFVALLQFRQEMAQAFGGG